MRKILLVVLFFLGFGVSVYADITTFKEVEKACNSGNIEECLNLGDIYFKGEEVPKDFVKAKEVYAKVCDAELADGCNRLGRIYYLANKELESQDFFEKSCDLENSTGCYFLGVVCEGVAKEDREYMKAKKSYEKSCNLGSSDGCYKLGNMYEFGYAWDNPKGIDYDRAKKLYEKSCNAGNSLGCTYYKNVMIRF